LNCWQFGRSLPLVFSFEPGFWVELGLQRARIQSPAGWFDGERHTATCYGHVASIRPVRVAPPPGVDRATRHFLETLIWQSWVEAEGHTVRELRWHVEEVSAAGITDVASERLVREPGSAWPAPELPMPLLTGAVFRMEPTGTVRYWIGGRFKRRGTIE
jgi:hypothetical protein